MPCHPLRTVLFLATLLIALLASFFAGRAWQHFTAGRHYREFDTQTFASPLGTLHLRHVTDTQGAPFLDPGTSVLTLDSGLSDEVTLYRATRVFQERFPWVTQVDVDGPRLQWSDGNFRYALSIEPLSPATAP